MSVQRIFLFFFLIELISADIVCQGGWSHQPLWLALKLHREHNVKT